MAWGARVLAAEAAEPLRPRAFSRPTSQPSQLTLEYTTLDETSVALPAWRPPKYDATKRNTLLQRWKDGDFTIQPERHIFFDVWDAVMCVAVNATAVILPYQVALVEEPTRTLTVVNRSIDLIFAANVAMTFNMAYPHQGHGVTDLYEKAPLKIAQHYMAFPFSDNFEAGWFWVDIFTVLPWDLFLRGFAPHPLPAGKAVRYCCVVRLLRMLRLVRILPLLNRWHAALGYSFAALSLTKCLGIVVLSLHWLACLWGSIAANDSEEGQTTWLVRWAEEGGRDPETFTHVEIYNLALYFATLTLTSVGYGDIRPTSGKEVALVTFMMITTGFLWAFVLANAVNIVTNLDTYTSRFHDRMDELNLLMRARKVNSSLRWRLRRYMYESFHVHRLRHQLQTIKWLSGGLQGELAMESGVDKVCNLVWYLRHVEDAVLVDLASQFMAEMFSSNEFIGDSSKLFVIRKGTCMRRARLLTIDDVVGEDMILSSDLLRDSVMPRTLNFVEVLALKRSDLWSVAEHHSDFRRQLRIAVIKLAIWRGVTYAATQVQVKGSKWERLWSDFQEKMQLERQRKRRSTAWGTAFQRNTNYERQNSPGSVEEEGLNELVRELRAVRNASESCLAKMDELNIRMLNLEGRVANVERGREQGVRFRSPSRSFGLASPRASTGT